MKFYALQDDISFEPLIYVLKSPFFAIFRTFSSIMREICDEVKNKVHHVNQLIEAQWRSKGGGRWGQSASGGTFWGATKLRLYLKTKNRESLKKGSSKKLGGIFRGTKNFVGVLNEEKKGVVQKKKVVKKILGYEAKKVLEGRQI